jgi:hypothetical protein
MSRHVQSGEIVQWLVDDVLYPLVNVNNEPKKITIRFMGKSTISMAIFKSKLFVYQRVSPKVPFTI